MKINAQLSSLLLSTVLLLGASFALAEPVASGPQASSATTNNKANPGTKMLGAVPEPAPYLLVGIGSLLLVAVARHRRQ